MTAIPYERQETANGCGAACLCMAYRSLGLACEQAALRAAVSGGGLPGAPRCRTNRLCQDALGRGFAAVIVQARAAREAPRRCLDAELRVIVNHRLSPGDGAGHYSLLVACDEERVELHDPLGGPGRALWWEEFLALWASGGEVVGHVLLAIGRRRAAPDCAVCGARLSGEVRCPLCRRGVPLAPGEALGCGGDCDGRLWRACYCPWCDGRIEGLGDEPWRLDPRRSWRS